MNKFVFILVLCLLVFTAPGRATIVLDLVDFTTGASSTPIRAGQTLSLKTLMTTTNNEAVGLLEYTIALTETDWTLSNREYTNYGWSDVLDDSVPTDGSAPTVISSSTFTFNTGRADFGDTSGTDVTIETFDLTIPTTTTPFTSYILTLHPVSAAGANGTPSLTGALGSDSLFTANALPVPEPGSLLLIGTALLSFCWPRRRLMTAKKSIPGLG